LANLCKTFEDAYDQGRWLIFYDLLNDTKGDASNPHIFTFDQLSLVVTTKKQFPLSSASKSSRLQSLPASVVVCSVVD
jgi:hypothetical protein